jgi:putative transcriptional regulator
MSRLFKGLKNGLEEALAHAEGKIVLKSKVIEIPEPQLNTKILSVRNC